MERFREVRARTLALVEPLSAEDCAVQSMPDASPAKWHLAHTTWFFETFLLSGSRAGYRPFDPAYAYLFNSYYNAVGPMHPRPARGMLTRPGLEEVRAYRSHVDREVLAAAAGGGLSADRSFVLELGLHHEQQHQELLLTDLKHLLYQNPLRPAYRGDGVATAQARPAAPAAWSRFESGVYEIGDAGTAFAFDNESPRHRVFLGGFEVCDRLVTVGEYLAFIDDGGYSRPELWVSDGFAVASQRGWCAPLYWELEGREWRLFTLSGMRPLAAGEPVVHVSWYEADAYARWAGARLPTEQEWEVAASAAPVEGNFVESARLHPGVASSSSWYGDAWCWTASPYVPYPGFKPLGGGLGEYNGKFMCNQFVLRGGSCATPRSHVRATYRNFFHPDARWQFSGFRLARDRGGSA